MTVIASGPRKMLIYSLLIATISSIVMGIVAIQYANYAIRKSQEQSNTTILKTQQQWCELIITFDDGYNNSPPTTTTGHLLAVEFKKLRREFQCKER